MDTFKNVYLKCHMPKLLTAKYGYSACELSTMSHAIVFCWVCGPQPYTSTPAGRYCIKTRRPLELKRSCQSTVFFLHYVCGPCPWNVHYNSFPLVSIGRRAMESLCRASRGPPESLLTAARINSMFNNS